MNASSTRKKSSAKGPDWVPVETSGRSLLPSRLPEVARGCQRSHLVFEFEFESHEHHPCGWTVPLSACQGDPLPCGEVVQGCQGSGLAHP